MGTLASGSIDLKSLRIAGEGASKYIVADSTGIMVYDGASGAQTPSTVSDSTNNVFIDDDSVDVRTGSEVKASFGPITTIGPEDSAHAEIQEDSFTIYNGVPTECFYISSSSAEVVNTRVYSVTDNNGITYSGMTSTGIKSKTYSELKNVAEGVRVIATHKTLKSSGFAQVMSAEDHLFRFNITDPSSTTLPKTLSINVYMNWNKETGVLSVSVPSNYIKSGTRKGPIAFYVTHYYAYESTPAPALLFGSLSNSGDVGAYSSAMGFNVDASGNYSHAEGWKTVASGKSAHAEGDETTASFYYSHAEGCSTVANNYASHAEGGSTTASGSYSHAEGYKTTSDGFYSHAEGYWAESSGEYSHAQNKETIASGSSQTAIGKYNSVWDEETTGIIDPYAFIIGNGSDINSRSNALTVSWTGDVDIADGGMYKINGVNLASVFYPVGSCYTTNTNTNPSTWLGGTWTLVDKRFTPGNGENGITWNTTNTKTERTFAWIRNDHDLWLRFRWTNNVAFSDTEQAICTIDMTTLGFKSGESGYYQWITGACDGINAALLMNLSWSGSTGTVYIQDAITRAATVPTTTGQPAYATMLVKCDLSHMDDSACNQFVWQRTA